MRLPRLFRKENSSAAQAERQAHLERAVTDGLRRLAQLLEQVANHVERQRLSRQGYEPREKFLERTDDRR